jgi:hypothetical protein
MDKNIQTLHCMVRPATTKSQCCTVRATAVWCYSWLISFVQWGQHTSIDINIELWEQGVAFHETALNILSI